MKRVRRRVFNGVAAVSLVLFPATILCWANSYTSGTSIGYVTRSSNPRNETWMYSCHGKIWIGTWDWAWDVHPDRRGFFYRPYPYPGDFVGEYNFAGFGFTKGQQIPNFRGFLVPYWFVTLATLLAPGRWFFRRKLLPVPGFCGVCGYDLRATPERCPECGTVAGMELTAN